MNFNNHEMIMIKNEITYGGGKIINNCYFMFKKLFRCKTIIVYFPKFVNIVNFYLAMLTYYFKLN